MQCRSPRHRGHRHRVGCDSRRLRTGAQASCPGSRNAPIPPGRAPHRLGTSPRRHPSHTDHRQHGRAFHEDRKSWRGRHGRGPSCRNGDRPTKRTYRSQCWPKKTTSPFYMAAPVSTFDLSVPDGDHIPIEERFAAEVTHIQNVRIAPDVHARSSGFRCQPRATSPPFSPPDAASLARPSLIAEGLRAAPQFLSRRGADSVPCCRADSRLRM